MLILHYSQEALYTALFLNVRRLKMTQVGQNMLL
jgi:hypothetical protein